MTKAQTKTALKATAASGPLASATKEELSSALEALEMPEVRALEERVDGLAAQIRTALEGARSVPAREALAKLSGRCVSQSDLDKALARAAARLPAKANGAVK